VDDSARSGWGGGVNVRKQRGSIRLAVRTPVSAARVSVSRSGNSRRETQRSHTPGAQNQGDPRRVFSGSEESAEGP
jgi:hypothetical protein